VLGFQVCSTTPALLSFLLTTKLNISSAGFFPLLFIVFFNYLMKYYVQIHEQIKLAVNYTFSGKIEIIKV
jgi:hypothetical protein